MAHLVHWGKFFPPHFGGIENVTSSLARGAALSGHAVTVVCFHSGPESIETTPEGVRVLRAPVALVKASQPIGWKYFRRIMLEGRRADVVHLHTPNFVAAAAAVLLGRGPRLVVHWHSDIVDKGLLGWALRPLERTVLRRADRIICTSSAYAESSAMIRRFAEKVTIVPIGVRDSGEDAKQGSVQLPEDLGRVLSGRRFVLAVGRLVPYKGFGVLIDAARHLSDDAAVVIVGSGPLQAELERRARERGVSGKVILAGRQPDNVLQALFMRAALFCLPSIERSEAFGVVLIEAMSHRLPIVATCIPGSGVPWVNQHNESGFNVPVGDPEGLAEACNRILESSALRERLAEGARQRFEREFTEAVSCGRVLAVYSQLLQSSPADSPSGRQSRNHETGRAQAPPGHR